MKKIKKKFYKILSSIAMSVAVLSFVELYSFCILIIHQPEVPERLRQKAGALSEKKNG